MLPTMDSSTPLNLNRVATCKGREHMVRTALPSMLAFEVKGQGHMSLFMRLIEPSKIFYHVTSKSYHDSFH